MVRIIKIPHDFNIILNVSSYTYSCKHDANYHDSTHSTLFNEINVPEYKYHCTYDKNYNKVNLTSMNKWFIK